MKTLLKIQQEIKANKTEFNAFGKYKYRTAEGILESLKPLLSENKAVVILTDDIVQLGDRYYVKATVMLKTENEEYVATALAREELTKKGMDAAQITGAASSYARKYALCGLLALDDTKDPDTHVPSTPMSDDNFFEEKEEIKYEKFDDKTEPSNTELNRTIVAFGKMYGDELKSKGFQNIQITHAEAEEAGFTVNKQYDKYGKKYVWLAPSFDALFEFIDVKGYQVNKSAKIDK